MNYGALIYARVSTLNQAEEGTSLETQAEAGIALAESLNIPVLRIYREVYTGTELYDRPRLSEAREEIKLGRCSHLIAYAIDRLSRNPIHLAIVVMDCDRAGVELHFVSEPIDNTPEGQLIQYVKGYAAQLEHAKIRERCMRGKHAIAVSGRIHRAGTDLYGYRRESGKRVVYAPEAIIVKHIFDSIVNGGSLRGLARELNTEAVLPPSVGKRVYKDGHTPRWTKSTITRIIREPSYKGQGLAWRWKSQKVHGRQRIVLRPASENIQLPEGVVPQIVEPVIWTAAQDYKPDGSKARNANREYLLRGSIFCQRCEARMYTETSKGIRYYRCSSRQKLSGACGAPAVRADNCEHFVWHKLQDLILEPEKIKAGMAWVKEDRGHAELRRELKNIESALKKSSDGLQKLVRRFATTESKMLVEAIEREVGITEQEQERLRTRASQIEAQLNSNVIVMDGFRKFEWVANRVREKLPQMGPRERALAMKAFRVKVTAEQRKVRMEIDLGAIIDGEMATTFSGYSQNTSVARFQLNLRRVA